MSFLSVVETMVINLFKNDVDKNNKPYIEHLERVANKITDLHFPTYVIAAAWLHDALEDHIESKEIIQQLVPYETFVLITYLTKDKNMDYNSYIDRLIDLSKTNEYHSTFGRELLSIKLIDLLDNTRLDRLSNLDSNLKEKLIQKYFPAIDRITMELIKYRK